ncbi:CBL-interacting serine/threonine-protein kinase 4 [Morella rubra]|uniref:non-specific serine/threonine protein kinase n=1 Tax=Morella rubra TaxID=262757 RepID=A0A6A1VZ53_9ROSI|nr:CBL-interacting serine/threonine-protein kinase 4 [Morella rubra]KAB1218085.1 CBL-interacting serine/threonine-protein kinase 4 [Morella rubra]
MEPGVPPPPISPPPSPSSGSTLLGKYQLGRLLGRGSFAKVYHARSIADGAAVAVKIIDKSKTVDAAMEPRIIREVMAMRRLQDHPNILKIHEVMATKTKICLVVELATGGELFSKISRRGKMSEPSVRRYFQQLVSALDFCHRNGVAHRDVKPQNLLLDKDGNLKVSDFGLSALPEQLQNGLLHTACGTPAYTAPEVVCRRGYDGSKADAWSCGVILFVLLAGYLPFDDSNIVAMYKKIHRRDYQFPAWFSKPARHVIFQLLDPNPDTRMGIEALMQNAWFKKSLREKPQNQSLFDSTSNGKDDTLTSMNAFDIISLSSGLDLSGLFETTTCSRKEKRFTSKVSGEGVIERVRDVGGRLGYRVEEGKSGSRVGLGKGRVVLVVGVSVIAPELVLVEVKVVEGGVEFEELNQWGDLKAGLQDIVVAWHSDNRDGGDG